MVTPKAPTVPKPSIAKLEDELASARYAYGELREKFETAEKQAEEWRLELRAVRAERDALKRSNEIIQQERINHASDVARFSGMLDMLREMGVIPKSESLGGFNTVNSYSVKG